MNEGINFISPQTKHKHGVHRHSLSFTARRLNLNTNNFILHLHIFILFYNHKWDNLIETCFLTITTKNMCNSGCQCIVQCQCPSCDKEQTKVVPFDSSNCLRLIYDATTQPPPSFYKVWIIFGRKLVLPYKLIF